MQPFAALLYSLTLAGTASEKKRLLTEYFKKAKDPGRGYALALITGDVALPTHTSILLRRLISDRVDTELFELSQKFTGDVSETISLMWPTPSTPEDIPSLAEILAQLQNTSKKELPDTLANLLDKLPTDSRWALLSLMKRSVQHGVSPRLAKQALAELKPGSLATLEEAWHPARPPYTYLFSWIDGNGPPPALDFPARYRPMLQPRAYTPGTPISPQSHSAEWLYDGLSVQLVCTEGRTYLYTSDGDDITRALTSNVSHLPFDAVFASTLITHEPDGTLIHPDQLNTLLKSKPALPKAWADNTITLFAHDLLSHEGTDLRSAPFQERRNQLDRLLESAPSYLKASQTLPFDDTSSLNLLRSSGPEAYHKGVRIKSRHATYNPAHADSPHMDWPCDPHTIDAVLLYAKRSSKSPTHDELTFGVWVEDGTLLRIGKSILETTPDDHAALDAFIKDNTLERFGPVRSVTATPEAGIVLNVMFEQLTPSTRHKAGYHLSTATISSIKWNTPPSKACTLNELIEMTQSVTPPSQS